MSGPARVDGGLRCRVHLASPLRSYFAGRVSVELDGSFATFDDLLWALELRAPGVRFRMVDERGRLREHLKLVARGRPCVRLSDRLPGGADVHVLAALSGG